MHQYNIYLSYDFHLMSIHLWPFIKHRWLYLVISMGFNIPKTPVIGIRILMTGSSGQNVYFVLIKQGNGKWTY